MKRFSSFKLISRISTCNSQEEQFPMDTIDHYSSSSSSSASSGESSFSSKTESLESEKYAPFQVDLDRVQILHDTPCSTLKLSDFSNLEQLAEGKNALLFRARVASKQVVIKMIKKASLSIPYVVKEFEIEKSILERANHPHIVKYYGSGCVPRRFIVIEYADQGTLDLSANQCINLGETIQRAKQIASALHYLHDLCVPGVSIIHRDLKPDNIGLHHGAIKLLDFGLSICVDRNASENDVYKMTGCTGTLRYMAPEVALHKSYNEKVDVYSFGILLWQMLSHQVPFAKETRATYEELVVRKGLRPPIDLTWPRELQELLSKCWLIAQEDRPSFHKVLISLDIIANKLH